MARLPYSRTVKVSVIRNDNFPAKQGFGTPLFLTTLAVAGQLDATHRTKLYASMDEVAADFDAGQSFYDAALQAFAQNPRPTAVKAGFVVLDGTPIESEFITQLDTIFDADQDFYFVCIENTMRDTVYLHGLSAWIEAKSKFAIIDSNDVDTETVSINSYAGTNKGLFERTAVFYDTNTANYGAFALAALLSTFNFDEANSAYTAKYKKLQGIAPLDKTSAVVQAITGFVPEVGQSTATGNCANCVIDIGDQFFVVEGSTLTPNVFIDEIHASDWIVARTEEEMLGILLNNRRVPFTDEGMEILAGAVRTVMAQARRAGLIAADFNFDTGEYEPSVIINVPSALSVPASQRKARVAPVIECQFRYAGAVHYSVVRYEMNF